MFLGTYYHQIDERGRVSIPKKIREQLGLVTVVTRGLDGCLFLFSQDAWEKVETKILAMPLTRADARSFARHMLSGAMDIRLDRLGRILLPKYLLDYAGLKDDIVVLGVGERVEIWDKQMWQTYSQDLESRTQEIAERLSELGI